MAVTAINNLTRTPVVLLAVVEAAALLSSTFVAGIVLCKVGLTCEYRLVGSLTAYAVLVTAVMLFSLVAVGLYHLQQRMTYQEVLARLFVAIAIGSLLVVGICYIALPVSPSAGFISASAVSALPALLVIRLYFVRNVDQNIFRRRTLIYGTGVRASRIASLRRQADRRGFKVVGNVRERTTSDHHGQQVVSLTMLDIALESGAQEIVIAVDDRRENLPMHELLECRFRGIDIIDLADFLERESGKVHFDLVSPGWFVFSSGFRQSGLSLFTKRVMDIVLSICALLVIWPVLLAVALATKIEDGWRSPILYRQKRVGQKGKPFILLKFRSMGVDAEADGRAVWAAKDDQRITKVGRFIRRTRLDELPQIFNVIGGHMSLVGPRPERPEFVESLSESIPYYADRHIVRPGITGWAQLRYSYAATEQDALEKLKYDLYYVKNHTLLLDLLIIIQTAEVVLWGKGAR